MSRPSTSSSGNSSSSAGTDWSFISDDSYLDKLKPADKAFQEMVEDIKVLESKRRILEERKMQSHIQKRRDPDDTIKREWSDNQVRDYEKYKLHVKTLSNANKKAMESTKVSRQKKDIKSREKALRDQKDKFAYGILAAESRLDFLVRYPDAFNTASHATHIKAVEDGLNAARAAMREVQIQLQKMADAVENEKRQAAAAAKSAGGSKGKN